MKKIWVLILALTMIGAAFAEDWKRIENDTLKGTEVYLDLDSVSIEGERASTRQKFVYTDENRKGQYSLLMVTLKTDNTFCINKMERFDSEGQLLKSGESQKFIKITPGYPIHTIYETVFKP